MIHAMLANLRIPTYTVAY